MFTSLTRGDLHHLRRLHYDLAGSPLPRVAPALLSFADPDRLHYGSDWPFTPTDTAARLANEIDTSDVFDEALRRKILLDNALALFPRLQVSGVDGGR